LEYLPYDDSLLSPQGEPYAGCNVVQPEIVTVISARLTVTWHLIGSQVAAGPRSPFRQKGPNFSADLPPARLDACFEN